VGLHEHTGSGIANTEKVYHAMKNLLSIADKVNFPHLQFINFGGGFKVPYHPSEAAIDYEKFGTIVTRMFAEYCQTYGRELYMCFEPGIYVVAEAGYLVVQVNTVKNNKGRLIIGTDSGFSQLIRPALYGAYHHILNLSNPLGKREKYDVCGNICESGDCFAKERLLPNVREGDYLAILNAGAYGFSMASLYNLRALPAEVVIQDNEVRLSRAMMTADELASKIMQQYPSRVERFLDAKR
jgi:diaminopimelate decarboxylase